MKKNEKQGLKNLSLEELFSKEQELRQTLFSQRLHKITRPIKDNQSEKKLRRDIACMLTLIQQKRSV